MTDFYEPDEDPAEILAIFDAGEKRLTGRPGDGQPAPSLYSEPEFTSYPDGGRRLWAWRCYGGPRCGGETAWGYDGEAQAREAWRQHVRRQHHRTRPPAAPNLGPTSTTVGAAPACACDHDDLPTEYHLDGCPTTGRPAPQLTDDQRADIADLARRIADMVESVRARHPSSDAPTAEPPPSRSPGLPPGAEECPPGVHSMFDPCPGNCTAPVIQLHHGGLARDEDGLSIQAWDDTHSDYEVRLGDDQARELAGHLIDAVDPGALAAVPDGPTGHLHAEYLAGYTDAITRIRRAVRHPGTEDQQ